MNKIQELLIWMLKRSEFFAELENEKLAKFANLFTLDMVRKNEAIIVEWHEVSNIYILKKWVLVAKKANWLNSVVLNEIDEWEIFWEMSFFRKTTAIASVVCESETADFWKIPRKDFERFIEENEELKIKITETILERDRENKEKLWDKIDTKSWNNEQNIDDIQINL